MMKTPYLIKQALRDLQTPYSTNIQVTWSIRSLTDTDYELKVKPITKSANEDQNKEVKIKVLTTMGLTDH